MKKLFLMTSLFILIIVPSFALIYPLVWWTAIIWAPLIILGCHDLLQKNHSILRNFPLVGHFRYLLEMIRPEINQYFIESNSDGRPFSREKRSIVYQRSKKALQTLPFGTQKDLYAIGHEWLGHSINPIHLPFQNYRVNIGGPDCLRPYSASIFNISAMSFGSLGQNAVLALNSGAKLGNFSHNTGEGGLSPHHLEGGGDIVWQIGTGYFGCRTIEGKFSAEAFADKAKIPQVKMVEIKLSQGAKPGHGGILPSIKLTPEIAKIRGVPMGQDVISPPGHSAFSTPLELLDFVATLRQLSSGKPIGIKLCIGLKHEFMALCKAMLAKKITPDFITIDGAEGGTGAAPLEFSNHMGLPLKEAIIFAHNALTGFGLRDKIKLIVSGKIITGFDIVAKLCLGADLCNSARGMLFSLGCIQALRCNSNDCPTGIATQKPGLGNGLVVSKKNVRVANYHSETMRSVHEILGAMGLSSPQQLRPSHLLKRTENNEVKNYQQLYTYCRTGEFLTRPSSLPAQYAEFIEVATENSFIEIINETHDYSKAG